jgi:hypothetical protein
VSGAAGGLDWQFVIVTLAAGWGGWVLLRPLLPVWGAKGAKKAAGACGRCSSPDCTKEASPQASGGLVSIGSGAPRKPPGAGA